MKIKVKFFIFFFNIVYFNIFSSESLNQNFLKKESSFSFIPNLVSNQFKRFKNIVINLEKKEKILLLAAIPILGIGYLCKYLYQNYKNKKSIIQEKKTLTKINTNQIDEEKEEDSKIKQTAETINQEEEKDPKEEEKEENLNKKTTLTTINKNQIDEEKEKDPKMEQTAETINQEEINSIIQEKKIEEKKDPKEENPNEKTTLTKINTNQIDEEKKEDSKIEQTAETINQEEEKDPLYYNIKNDDDENIIKLKDNICKLIYTNDPGKQTFFYSEIFNIENLITEYAKNDENFLNKLNVHFPLEENIFNNINRKKNSIRETEKLEEKNKYIIYSRCYVAFYYLYYSNKDLECENGPIYTIKNKKNKNPEKIISNFNILQKKIKEIKQKKEDSEKKEIINLEIEYKNMSSILKEQTKIREMKELHPLYYNLERDSDTYLIKLKNNIFKSIFPNDPEKQTFFYLEILNIENLITEYATNDKYFLNTLNKNFPFTKINNFIRTEDLSEYNKYILYSRYYVAFYYIFVKKYDLNDEEGPIKIIQKHKNENRTEAIMYKFTQLQYSISDIQKKFEEILEKNRQYYFSLIF
jgi:hypothetical protein